ncbi:MAG: VWA domain-containing protein [Bacteroidia bacterium]
MERKNTYKLIPTSLTVVGSQVLLWAVIFFFIWFAKNNYPQFKIENEDDFIYVLIIPVLMLIYLLNLIWKNKALKRWSDEKLLNYSTPKLSSFKTTAKAVLFFSALSLFFIAYLNPQFGTKEKTLEVKGIDIIVALDVSTSMLARDLSEEQSRLDLAKRGIENLTKKLRGDRFGVVVFAGKAFTQIPITSDYSAVKLFLPSISTDMMNSQGTAIGNAIDIALSSFDFSTSTNKAIIIISDGENHEEGAKEMAESSIDKGVVINTIGMGTSKSVPIPIYKNKKFLGNKKDKNGNTVLTKLNEDMLKELASIGKGTYVKATAGNSGLDIILDDLKNLEKRAYDKKQYLEYEDQFQWFLALGILCLLTSLMIDEKVLKEE